jgi:predicted N-acetyltransferase YhbS
MVIHEETGNIVATAMAVHGPTDAFPFGGELGWVAGDPEHSGKNLGMAVCSAVTSRLLDMGYRLIHLNTDELSVRNWTGRIPQRFGG